jgi:sugar O-acyltransferase (sialic acid O-acetyltransferase NeuD family)
VVTDRSQPLIILGAGVHAGEMAEIVERVNQAAPTWRLLGFLAADDAAPAILNGYPVLGPPAALEGYPEAALVPAFGWPHPLVGLRERLAVLVDPSAFVSRAAVIGPGSVVYPHGFVGANARLEEQVFCLSGSTVNHDNRLEARVVLASGVTLAGHVRVEADCYLGQRCTVRQRVRIGRGSLVGMGAVVLDDVPPNSVVVGNPARWLRPRFPDPG